jgi:hypothetical protein
MTDHPSSLPGQISSTAGFEASLDRATAPEGLPTSLAALWHAGRGDWSRAHELVQDATGTDSAWVHAYLHREEGDLGNAQYWYRRAGKPAATGDLRTEWRAIVGRLLEAGRS